MKPIAVAFSSSPYITVQKSSSVINPINKASMFRQSHQVPFKKAAATLKIRSCSKTKVFENQFEGIICYRDENGEIVCEGYDEGPRFQQQIPRATFHPRDAEIMNIILQRWHEITNGDKSDNAADKSGVSVQEDINWNGFNIFY